MSGMYMQVQAVGGKRRGWIVLAEGLRCDYTSAF